MAAKTNDEKAVESIPEGLLCPKCSYDVRGLTSQNCPECGQSLAGLRDAGWVIPWERRAELGWIRAYISSAFLNFREPGGTRRLYIGTLSLRDANLFSVITIAIACLPLFLGTIWLASSLYASYLDWDPVQSNAFVTMPSQGDLARQVIAVAAARIWPLVIALLILLLWLMAISSAPSIVFRSSRIPERVQDNAVAMSRYATIWPIPIGFAVLLIAGGGAAGSGVVYFIVHPLVLGVAAGVLIYLIDLMQLARVLMPQSRRRAWLVWMVVPVLWASISIVLLLVVPLAVLCLDIAVRSLW